MNNARFDKDSREIFLQEEKAGLRLAMEGRMIALFFIALWVGFTRSYPHNLLLLGAVLAFAVNTLALLIVTGSKLDRVWFKYLFATIDAVLIAVVFLSGDLSHIAPDLPRHLVFRFDSFPFLFILIATSAFAYSPLFVLSTGIVFAAVWFGGFGWIISDMENPLSWGDIPANPSAQQYIDVFLDIRFVGAGSRIQEAAIIIATAGLLALAVQRARRVAQRQVQAEQERELVSHTFGRYLPPAVAQALIADKGVPAPLSRTATVLFVDIVGFTTISESLRPAQVVEMMNAYFDAVAEAIARYEGVITQFLGDAILATFNVPIADPQHAKHAVAAGLALIDAVDGKMFAG